MGEIGLWMRDPHPSAPPGSDPPGSDPSFSRPYRPLFQPQLTLAPNLLFFLSSLPSLSSLSVPLSVLVFPGPSRHPTLNQCLSLSYFLALSLSLSVYWYFIDIYLCGLLSPALSLSLHPRPPILLPPPAPALIACSLAELSLRGIWVTVPWD